MRQTFYCLTALPKDSDSEVWIGHTYSQKRNALRFAESVRDTFRRVSVWQGYPGSVLVATLGEPYPAPSVDPMAVYGISQRSPAQWTGFVEHEN